MQESGIITKKNESLILSPEQARSEINQTLKTLLNNLLNIEMTLPLDRRLQAAFKSTLAILSHLLIYLNTFCLQEEAPQQAVVTYNELCSIKPHTRRVTRLSVYLEKQFSLCVDLDSCIALIDNPELNELFTDLLMKFELVLRYSQSLATDFSHVVSSPELAIAKTVFEDLIKDIDSYELISYWINYFISTSQLTETEIIHVLKQYKSPEKIKTILRLTDMHYQTNLMSIVELGN